MEEETNDYKLLAFFCLTPVRVWSHKFFVLKGRLGPPPRLKLIASEPILNLFFVTKAGVDSREVDVPSAAEHLLGLEKYMQYNLTPSLRHPQETKTRTHVGRFRRLY